MVNIHEISIVYEVLEIVNENMKAYNLRKINKIILKIGKFTCIDEKTLRFAFDSIIEGTIFDNTELIIEKIEACAFCNNCKQSFSIDFTNKICPICNEYSSDITTGYELMLERIEGE